MEKSSKRFTLRSSKDSRAFILPNSRTIQMMPPTIPSNTGTPAASKATMTLVSITHLSVHINLVKTKVNLSRPVLPRPTIKVFHLVTSA